MHSGRALKFTEAGSWIRFAITFAVEAVYECAAGHEVKHKAAMSRDMTVVIPISAE